MEPLPACPRFQPIGEPPPVVLSSSQAAQGIANAKAADPGKTIFVFAVFSNQNDAWRMLVEESGQLSIPSSEAIVVLENHLGWDKSVTTVNGNDCNFAGQLLNVAGNSIGQMTIKKVDTTTLVFSKPVCTFRIIVCFSTVWKDVAVFGEANFWTLFGGRKITFTWLSD